MGDFIDLKWSGDHVLFKINSGAMRFKLKPIQTGIDILFLSDSFDELYRIVIGPNIEILDLHSNGQVILSALENTYQTLSHPRRDYQEYWVTWYHGQIKIGSVDPEPLTSVTIDRQNIIRYVRFVRPPTARQSFSCLIERSPVKLQVPKKRKIDGGQLHWVRMHSGSELPRDAMVGGFENELIYIARAYHNGSLCPGKFVPSKKTAYIPWGHREHAKTEFEILCGFNADWVSTKSDYIPENAFIAGNSEVHNAPLYIGRAMHDGYLLTGKVHTLYKTCYLPYDDKEIEVGSYEILVTGDIQPRGLRGLYCKNDSIVPVIIY